MDHVPTTTTLRAGEHIDILLGGARQGCGTSTYRYTGSPRKHLFRRLIWVLHREDMKFVWLRVGSILWRKADTVQHPSGSMYQQRKALEHIKQIICDNVNSLAEKVIFSY